MPLNQVGILAKEARFARYLTFAVDQHAGVESALASLSAGIDTEQTVVGIGASVLKLLGKSVTGLRDFPVHTSAGIEIPSTPAALWCWLRGDDRGELYLRSRQITEMLGPAFMLTDVTDAFQYDLNRDLSGYEDGTENPQGDAAERAALVQNAGEGLDGSSFVAVQQWLHDFDMLDTLSTAEKDDIIGRHIADNEEFDEAPQSAHVKRSAQESFAPEAFILRRSMPWANDMDAGLMFVAFGKSFDAFEAILERMSGNADGIPDALFGFTRPITGAYFWWPPSKADRLDLSILGI